MIINWGLWNELTSLSPIGSRSNYFLITEGHVAECIRNFLGSWKKFERVVYYKFFFPNNVTGNIEKYRPLKSYFHIILYYTSLYFVRFVHLQNRGRAYWFMVLRYQQKKSKIRTKYSSGRCGRISTLSLMFLRAQRFYRFILVLCGQLFVVFFKNRTAARSTTDSVASETIRFVPPECSKTVYPI